MTDNATSEQDSSRPDQHHSHVKTFLLVFGCLCALTAASFAIANSSLMDSKLVAWVLMMAISCAKAMLVISFFMHLKWEANWKFTLTIPATVMSILLCLILVPDIMNRTSSYSRARKIHAAAPADQAGMVDEIKDDHE